MEGSVLQKLHRLWRGTEGQASGNVPSANTISSLDIRHSATKGIDMQKNSIRNMALVMGPAAFLLGLVAAPQPAEAGFKWVAPRVQQAPSPVVQAYPEAQVIMGQQPSVVTGDVKVIMAPESMSIAAPQPAPAPANPDVVEGFADDVPLSVALRQVLPNGVGFSVVQDVSLGTLVSWRGGRPWRDVLRTMLAPKKLTIKEEGGLVHVVHAGSVKPVAPAVKMKASAPQMAAFKPAAAPAPAMRPMPAPATNPMTLAPAKPAPRHVYGAQPTMGQTLGYLQVGTSISQQNRMPQAWVAHKGQMLRAVLMDWGRKANVDVSWQAEYDYPFQASVSVGGTFEEAVRSLLSGFQDADPKPVGYLYNSQKAGQRVLVIQTRGNKYAD